MCECGINTSKQQFQIKPTSNLMTYMHSISEPKQECIAMLTSNPTNSLLDIPSNSKAQKLKF